MKKIDLKKQFSGLYQVAKGKILVLNVPPLNYLMIDGQGDPNTSQEFPLAVEALYSLSYTLKFMVKKGGLQIDYGVMPLEGTWWTDHMETFSMEHKEDWKWTLMVMQPDFITPAMVQEAKESLAKRRNIPSLPFVRLEPIHEGLSAQVLYEGPYKEETATIIKLHDFIKDNGYKLTGKHREIYLNDMRRTAPEKLKTIIRQPIEMLHEKI